MDMLKQIIEYHEAHTKLGITKNAALCAAAIETYWGQNTSLTDDHTVHKDLQFATVQQCLEDLDHLNGSYRRSLIDALNQRLFKTKYYKKPRSKPFVKKDVVAAKALIDDVLLRAENLLQDQRGLRVDQSLFLALMYAVLESGLCFSEGVTALYEKLIASNEVLVRIGNHWIIELRYTRPNHPTNLRENGKAWTGRLFYPSPNTLFAIRGFMKHKKMMCVENSAMNAFKIGLVKLTGQQGLATIKDSLLLRACGMFVSEQPGTVMGSYLMHYATGHLSSTSTSRASLMCLQTQNFQKAPTRIKKDNSALEPAKHQVQKKKEIPVHYSEFNEGLRELFKTEHRKNHSRDADADEVIETLDQFSKNRRNDFSEPEQLLFDWLRYNFQTRNLAKFASGARYVSSVATVWLDVCERIAVCALEQDEINDLYDVLIDKAKLTDKQYPERIEDFMHFLHREKDIDLPMQLAPKDEKEKTHVRSNLPAPAHLNQLLIDINEVYSDTTFHIRESVLVMLILMTRLALRPNEVCNIQMKDISLLGVGHVFVRGNRHFKEKSSSSRRQLELNTFLLDQEIKFVRRFFKRRMSEEKIQIQADGRVTIENKSGLLFTRFVGHNAFFDMRELSAHVTKLLTSYSGVRTVMYQLRHSALSSLALVSLGSDDSIEKLTPYGLEKAKEIKAYIQPKDTFNILYKISSVAGHLDSSISLSTYCHFTDLLLYEAVIRKSSANDLRMIRNLSGVQYARLEKLSTKPGSTPHSNSELKELANRVLEGERGMWAKILPTKELEGRNIVMDNIFEISDEFTAESVSFILESFDRGLGIDGISELYNVDRRMVECVIYAAEKLKHTFKTKQERFRLYKDGSKQLSVSSPSGIGGTSESTRILQKLMPKSMEKIPPGLRGIIHKYLSTTMYTHPYIPVRSPEEVKEILQSTNMAVPESRWLLSIGFDDAIPKDEINSYWGSVSETVGRFRIIPKSGGMRQNKHGLGYLYFLRHDLTQAMLKNMQEKDYRQYSSRAVLKACHELAIYSRALRHYSDANFKLPD